MSSVNEVTVHLLFAKKRRENLLKSVGRYRMEKNLIQVCILPFSNIERGMGVLTLIL